MSRPGPKPAPSVVRALRGDGEARRTAEPRPRLTAPAAPRGMSAPARIVWRSLAPELFGLGLLTPLDVPCFEVLCEAVAFFRQARDRIVADGLLVKGRRDGFVTNPAWRVMRDAAQIMRVFASELGLTPAERSRLRLPPTTADNGWPLS
jgi:P27 family predicted phage terminase small subunit